MGRCNDCSMNDKNNGYYGYYMSVDNCSNSKCDIYINVLDKRHECLGSGSITECLMVNPTRVLFYDRTTNREIVYVGSEGLAKAKEKSQNIQSNEVSYTLLNRMMRPCGEGVSDIRTSDGLGCYPYSDNVFGSSDICPNGSKTMYSKNCGDSACGMVVTDGRGNRVNNPCSVRIKYDDTNLTFKNDLCSYICPSYLTQRIFLQKGTNTISESQVCSAEYAELCELSGCVVDPACRIKWGGCEYTEIDMDLCNGATWFINNTTYSNNKLCNNQYYRDYCSGGCGEGYVRRCNTMGYAGRLLPTVVRVDYFGRSVVVESVYLFKRYKVGFLLHNDSGSIGFIRSPNGDTVFRLNEMVGDIFNLVYSSDNKVVRGDVENTGVCDVVVSTGFPETRPYRWYLEKIDNIRVRFVLLNGGNQRLGYLAPCVDNIWKNSDKVDYYCRAKLLQYPDDTTELLVKGI